MKGKKKWIIIASIGVLLIGAYIALPYVILKYANKSLREMKGYRGSIEDIDINLWRGAYKIQNLKIEKTTGKIPIPFVDINEIDLSVEWRALLKGSIVGEIIMRQPKVNFVSGPTKAQSQTGEGNDWTKPIKDLMPLEINRFEVFNGKITYNDFYSKPKVNIAINNFNLKALNLNNVEDKSVKLPSTVTATATSMGNGKLNLDMKANILKEIPDIDSEFKLTDVNLKELNEFAKAYGKFDFEKGKFSLFSELSLDNGKIDGYVKPFFDDIKILNWKNEREEEDKKNIFSAVWEAIIGLGAEVVENQPRDQIATKIPIEGTYKKLDLNTWKTVTNLLKNAFIKAFKKNIEETVSFGKGEEKDKKDKKKKNKKKED